MPQVGEQRSANGETRAWNGSRWEAVGAAPTQVDPEQGALSKFLGGALKTSPLNPMNLVRAVAHPVDTLGSMFGDPLKNAAQVPGDLADVVTGERGGGPIMGRVTSALEALKHIGGSVPLIGPAGVEAGNKIGEGDIAGGAGELTGIASGALLPKVAGAAPEAISKVGRGAEAAGTALKGSRMSLGGISIPMTGLGAAEAMFGNHPIAGAAVAATPYALEYGGKGLQKVGGALEGLRSAIQDPKLSGNYGGLNRVSKEVEGTRWPDNPSQMDSLGFTKDYQPKAAGGFDDILGEEGPSGGFDWPEAGGRFEPNAGGSHVLEPEIPDFTFEGESTGRPGEYPVGPAAPGFSTGSRPSLQGLNQFDAEFPMNDAAPSPIEQFYADNPGAATGGEGRTTGHFEEGPGGLSHLAEMAPELSPLSSIQLPEAWKTLPNDAEVYADMTARYKKAALERAMRKQRPSLAALEGLQ